MELNWALRSEWPRPEDVQPRHLSSLAWCTPHPAPEVLPADVPSSHPEHEMAVWSGCGSICSTALKDTVTCIWRVIHYVVAALPRSVLLRTPSAASLNLEAPNMVTAGQVGKQDFWWMLSSAAMNSSSAGSREKL